MELLEDDIYVWFNDLQANAKKVDGRVRMLPLEVNYIKPFEEAAMDASNQMRLSYNARMFADQYAMPQESVVQETIVLFNWSDISYGYKKALEWGLQNKLRKTVPHALFALGRQYPDLNRRLDRTKVEVVETTGCLIDGCGEACYAWWRGRDRGSYVRMQGLFIHDSVWYAFLK
ncbi:MAG TPA: hypothetical protein VL576_00090 [Candidatus Paceibacterota bacterium]|jgi:hypothetical protein|nr:hypothetical protein [Candidatus Paceibacterota bacterium]